MSFEELQPITSTASPIKPERVYMNGFHRPGKKESNSDHVGYRIVIGADVLKRIGWKDHRGFAAKWGTDEDLGKLKLVEIETTAPGWKGTLSKAGYLSIRITRMPATCTLDKFELTAVLAEERKLQGGATYLLIDLPNEFYNTGASIAA